MIKKLLVVSLAALGIGLTGCLTDPEPSSAPQISLTAIGTVVAGSGVAQTATGTISAEEAIVGKPNIDIVNSSNQSVGETVIARTLSITENKEKSQKFTLTLQAFSGAPTDTYTVKITASTSVSGTANFKFFVQGSSVIVPDIVEKTVTLGSYDNATVGSSIDLDNGTIMSAATAKAANSGVDILYTYSAKTSGSVIFNPVYARDSSKIDAFSGWVSPNDTKFHKVTVDYSTIKTAAQIKALFVENSATAMRLSVSLGDVIIVKTDNGNYILVKIVSVFADKAATADIKYAK